MPNADERLASTDLGGQTEAAAGSQVYSTKAAAGETAPLGRRLIARPTFLALGLGLVFLVLAVRGLHISPTQVWHVMQRTDLRLFFLAFVVHYSSFVARTERWRRLMGNANQGAEHERVMRYPLSGLMEILFISWFVNCVIPARLGDVYRGYLARQCIGLSMSRTVGTVVAERMLDMLVLFPLLAASTVWVFWSRLGHLPEPLRLALTGGVILAVVALVVLGSLWRLHGAIHGVLPPRAARLFTQLRHGVLYSLHGAIALPLILTVFAWCMEGGRLAFILASLHLNLGPGTALFLALAASILTTLPLTAGGLGVVESFLTVALATIFLNGVPNGKTIAVSAAVLDRLISYVSVVVLGLLVWLVSKKTRAIGVVAET